MKSKLTFSALILAPNVILAVLAKTCGRQVQAAACH
jgi:hypothetical protein